jgi:hypothetical protein
MQIICRGRCNGKTIEAIKISAEKGCYIICHSQKECTRIFHLAKEMGLDIPFPITFDEFKGGRYYAGGVKGFIVDNAEILLQSMSPVPIRAITVNK